METIVRDEGNGLAVTVTDHGEPMALPLNASVVFENVAGAHVTLSADHDSVACEAAVPESHGRLRWTFERDHENHYHPQGFPLSDAGMKSLEEMVCGLRVALNGRF